MIILAEAPKRKEKNDHKDFLCVLSEKNFNSHNQPKDLSYKCATLVST